MPLPTLSRGCWIPVALVWLGIALGLISFGSTVMASPTVERRVFAPATMPAPSEITAYTTAICGAVVTLVNTGLLIWHKLTAPRRTRRKRKPRAAESAEKPS